MQIQALLSVRFVCMCIWKSVTGDTLRTIVSKLKTGAFIKLEFQGIIYYIDYPDPPKISPHINDVLPPFIFTATL